MRNSVSRRITLNLNPKTRHDNVQRKRASAADSMVGNSVRYSVSRTFQQVATFDKLLEYTNYLLSSSTQ